jgi:general stress protein 26
VEVSRMTEADVYQFIAQNKLGVLGTVAHCGTPQSALVGIAVTPDLEIIFDTVKSSRKYPNLIARPTCCFTIGWTGEETVQYEGRAEELKGPELERYQKVYFKAWPDCQAHLSWPGIVYFVVKPTWIRYSDFDDNPPRIREFTFGGVAPKLG